MLGMLAACKPLQNLELKKQKRKPRDSPAHRIKGSAMMNIKRSKGGRLSVLVSTQFLFLCLYLQVSLYQNLPLFSFKMILGWMWLLMCGRKKALRVRGIPGIKAQISVIAKEKKSRLKNLYLIEISFLTKLLIASYTQIMAKPFNKKVCWHPGRKKIKKVTFNKINMKTKGFSFLLH